MMAEKTILLVEDNADDEALTLRALEKSTLINKVIVCRDGADALNYLFGGGQFSAKDRNELPVVVLLDLKLPKVDGLEVLRRIRENEQTHWVPVVILTSSREDDDVVKGYKSGANSYIRKPIDFVQFTDAITQLGLYWLMLNENVPRP